MSEQKIIDLDLIADKNVGLLIEGAYTIYKAIDELNVSINSKDECLMLIEFLLTKVFENAVKAQNECLEIINKKL